MESKKERFVKIAEARTNKIIDTIRLLGNYSSNATYRIFVFNIKKGGLLVIGEHVEIELNNKTDLPTLMNDSSIIHDSSIEFEDSLLICLSTIRLPQISRTLDKFTIT